MVVIKKIIRHTAVLSKARAIELHRIIRRINLGSPISSTRLYPEMNVRLKKWKISWFFFPEGFYQDFRQEVAVKLYYMTADPGCCRRRCSVLRPRVMECHFAGNFLSDAIN